MAKAIADPEEIRRFAHDLKRFNDDLTHQLQLMRSRMATLSQSWRDQEQRKFEEEFDFTVKAMDRFTKSISRTNPILASQSTTHRRLLTTKIIP